MNLYVVKTGRIASLSIIILTFIFLLSLVVFGDIKFKNVQDYVTAFEYNDLIPVIPGFLLTIVNIPLFVSLYFYAGNGKRIFALSGMIFGIGYVFCSGINYFTQLSLVPHAVKHHDYDLLSLFLMINPESFSYSLDHLGYLFLAISFIFYTGIFSKSSFHSWIKVIFLVYSISAIIGTVGYLLKITVLENMALISALPYLSGIILLYIEFGRIKKLNNLTI